MRFLPIGTSSLLFRLHLMGRWAREAPAAAHLLYQRASPNATRRSGCTALWQYASRRALLQLFQPHLADPQPEPDSSPAPMPEEQPIPEPPPVLHDHRFSLDTRSGTISRLNSWPSPTGFAPMGYAKSSLLQ